MPVHTLHARCLLAGGLFALGLPGVLHASDETVEIARTGPGNIAPSVFFSDFSPPSVNNAGAVLFRARLAGENTTPASASGIFVHAGASVGLALSQPPTIVIRENDSIDADGLPLQANSLFLSTVYLKDVQFPLGAAVTGAFRDVVFELPVRSGLPNGNTAILRERPFTVTRDDFQTIAAEGEAVPNGDGQFGDLGGFNLFGFGQSGEVGFFASLDETSAGAANDTALYRYADATGTVEIVREGDTVGGHILSGIFAPQMNTHGGMVFLGGLVGEPLSSDTAIYRVSALSSDVVDLAHEGDDTPTGDGAFATLSQLRINNNGEVAFAARLRDTDGLPGTPFAGSSSLDDSALYLERVNGGRVEMVREGDLVPSGDLRFGHFADALTGDVPRPALNDHGALAFRVELFDASDARPQGVFIASPDSLTEVARTGEAYESGVLASVGHPVLNNAGMAAFMATLDVGTQTGDEGEVPILRSLLMVSDGIDYATVVREGDALHGEVVLDIGFNNDPDGQTNGFSDDGVVTYKVLYESGVQAINLWAPTLSLRVPLPDPADPLEWEDAANWRFGLTPGVAHDVLLNPEMATALRSPTRDTLVKSIALGAGAGAMRLILEGGTLGTVQGLNIGTNSVVEGGGSLEGPVRNEGLVQVSPGLALTATGELVNLNEIAVADHAQLRVTGRYSGDGRISGAGLTLFGGRLDPGNSPALLEVAGDATLEAGNETIIEIAGLDRGTAYDSLHIGGTLTLGGSLIVTLIDDYDAMAGTSFLLADAGRIDGSFATSILPDVAGLRFLLQQDATSLRLQVQAVPLPASIYLLLGACGVLAARRRR